MNIITNCPKIGRNVDQCFPKPKMTFSNILFWPQPNDIQFTVTEEERKLKIYTHLVKSIKCHLWRGEKYGETKLNGWNLGCFNNRTRCSRFPFLFLCIDSHNWAAKSSQVIYINLLPCRELDSIDQNDAEKGQLVSTVQDTPQQLAPQTLADCSDIGRQPSVSLVCQGPKGKDWMCRKQLSSIKRGRIHIWQLGMYWREKTAFSLQWIDINYT